MRHILNVRPEDQPYVRLAHYDGLDFADAAHDQHPDRPTAESVTALRRRLQASQRLHLALEAESASNEALLAKLRRALGVRHDDDDDDGAALASKREGRDEADHQHKHPPGPFAFLGNKGRLEEGGADRPITTTAEFALSQLQALRSLSAALRATLPDLGPVQTAAAAASSEDGGSKSSRRERVEYVEGSSRKYLERARALELGPRGEVRDGEWQGEGRRLSKAEVDGLEHLASLLGGSTNDVAPSAGGGSGGGNDDAMDESAG